MTAREILEQVEATGVVAIIRASSSGELIDVVAALRAGGVTCIEVTMTTPDALEVIRQARQACEPPSAIGVGSVLDPETARAAILAGAQFVVAPITCLETIALCRRYSVPVMPGAMTPTEAVRAWQSGADVVKIFPTSSLGPAVIKDLKGPLPQIKLMPTGGVNLETVGAFMKAGATAVGVGGALVSAKALRARDFDGIRTNAAAFLEQVRQARGK